MFKGIQPSGQPPSLRKIAESNASANFRPDGDPTRPPEAQELEGPRPQARRDGAAGKMPFKGVRNG